MRRECEPGVYYSVTIWAQSMLTASERIANAWRDLTLSLLANLAQTWRHVVHHVLHNRPLWMLHWLATLPLRLVTRTRAASAVKGQANEAVLFR